MKNDKNYINFQKYRAFEYADKQFVSRDICRIRRGRAGSPAHRTTNLRQPGRLPTFRDASLWLYIEVPDDAHTGITVA